MVQTTYVHMQKARFSSYIGLSGLSIIRMPTDNN